MKKRLLPGLLMSWFLCGSSFGWGFFAHQRINRLAVFGLPPEMIKFYKHHIVYLTENAVNPDRRRYAVEGEAPRHYIDLDDYGPDSSARSLPLYWQLAVAKYTEDTLNAHGVVPWHIQFVKRQLTEAFVQRDVARILRLSADLGHYIADANVPLHTTSNYNGQQTGQHGIHGLWESRLPELYLNEYDFFTGQAQYVPNPQTRAWQAVWEAHAAVDSVLQFEKELTKRFPADKKYSFEQRGNVTVRVYSQGFTKAYHQLLAGQVERRLRASIRMVADFWLTCWIDAGQPPLNNLLEFEFSRQEKEGLEQEKQQWEKRLYEARPHDTGYVPRRRYYYHSTVG